MARPWTPDTDIRDRVPLMVRVSNAPEAFGVSRDTIYRWAKKDLITIHKRGQMSFVDPIEVRAFILGDGG